MHRQSRQNSGARGRQARRSCRAVWIFAMAVLLCGIPASAEITGTRITKDETVSVGGTAVRHVVGAVSGKAERNEPGVPTLDKVVGLKYESDFELWLPVASGNGRFWFSVLNRGNDVGGLRDGILRRGGAYGWCAWQAKNVAPPKPQLKLTGFDGPMPQAYGLVVVRDFVAFLRYAPGGETKPNPAAGKVKFAFAYGISQSGRFMRTFLLHGLNTAPGGQGLRRLAARRRTGGIHRLFPPELRSRLGRHVQSRDRVRPLFLVGPDGAFRIRRQGVRPECRERILRDDGLYDPSRAGAGQRAGLRFPAGRSWRRRDGALARVHSAVVGRAGGVGRQRHQAARQSDVRPGETRKPASQAPAVRAGRTAGDSTSWASPRAACGCRRSRCPSSVMSPTTAKLPKPCRWTRRS